MPTLPLEFTFSRFAPPVATFNVPAPEEKMPVPASPEKLSAGAAAVPCVSVIAFWEA